MTLFPALVHRLPTSFFSQIILSCSNNQPLFVHHILAAKNTLSWRKEKKNNDRGERWHCRRWKFVWEWYFLVIGQHRSKQIINSWLTFHFTGNVQQETCYVISGKIRNLKTCANVGRPGPSLTVTGHWRPRWALQEYTTLPFFCRLY